MFKNNSYSVGVFAYTSLLLCIAGWLTVAQLQSTNIVYNFIVFSLLAFIIATIVIVICLNSLRNKQTKTLIALLLIFTIILITSAVIAIFFIIEAFPYSISLKIYFSFYLIVMILNLVYIIILNCSSIIQLIKTTTKKLSA